MEVKFKSAKNGGVMTRIDGQIAFPERNCKHKPKPGESWEVEISGENAKGTVAFLRLIRKSPGQSEYQKEWTKFIVKRFLTSRVEKHIKTLTNNSCTDRHLRSCGYPKNNFQDACAFVEQVLREYKPPIPQTTVPPYQYDSELVTHPVCPGCGSASLVNNLSADYVPDSAYACGDCGLISGGTQQVSPCVICGETHDNLLAIHNIPEWNRTSGNGAYDYIPGIPNTVNICRGCVPALAEKAGDVFYE